MVGAAGLEPATLCLEGRCSIRLSYAPIYDGPHSATLIEHNTRRVTLFDFILHSKVSVRARAFAGIQNATPRHTTSCRFTSHRLELILPEKPL
jgi:hypothetical protein